MVGVTIVGSLVALATYSSAAVAPAAYAVAGAGGAGAAEPPPQDVESGPAPDRNMQFTSHS